MAIPLRFCGRRYYLGSGLRLNWDITTSDTQEDTPILFTELLLTDDAFAGHPPPLPPARPSVVSEKLRRFKRDHGIIFFSSYV